MIPKKIQYCWFGQGKMPVLAEKCIESWRTYCPDYEIIEWNEDNFNINCCSYVKEAYENRKFAFVTDYARLYILYTQGGIYMDTDVEVIKRLDEFLHNKAFSGFESKTAIPTGIMAAEKGFPLYEHLLSYYNNRHFISRAGCPDTTTNVTIITSMLTERGFVPNGKYQVIDDFVLYPRDYFCPFDNATGVLHQSPNTAVIHWFNKSWVPQKQRIRSKITRVFHRIFGINCFIFLKGTKRG